MRTHRKAGVKKGSLVSPKSLANLKPFKKGDPQVAEWGRQGGRGKSVKKSIGRKLYLMKQKGYNDEQLEDLVSMMQDADYSAFDVMASLKKLRFSTQSEDMQLKANKALIEWQKVFHGSRSPEININIQNMIPEKIEEEAKRILDADFELEDEKEKNDETNS